VIVERSAIQRAIFSNHGVHLYGTHAHDAPLTARAVKAALEKAQPSAPEPFRSACWHIDPRKR
jgi:hypothetical protein